MDKEKGWKKLPWMWLDFRHTFGSQLAQKGESLYKISKLMGNSPEICRRHYAALIPEEMRDTVEFDTPGSRERTVADVNRIKELDGGIGWFGRVVPTLGVFFGRLA